MMQPDASARLSSSQTRSLSERILAELQQHVGTKDYAHWFHGRVSVAADGHQVTLGVASPFLLNWLHKRFRREAAAAAQAVLGPSASVQFAVQAPAEQPAPASVPLAATMTSAACRERRTDCQSVRESAQCRLNLARIDNPSYAMNSAAEPPRQGRRFSDLSDFVADEQNELALMAAAHVARSPGTRYNPLFLYGNVGCGKTHLLEGIYRGARQNHPLLKTVYLTAEAFTNYFTQALRKHALPGFRERFRTCDVLLVDDVDFLDGKNATQEEFLHTFDQLARNGRQIVLASDRHPRLLQKTGGELATRFISGLTCRVLVPDLEGRIEILQRKAREMQTAVKPEALRHVAGRFRNSVRELLGALNCVATQHELTGKPVGLTGARQVLSDLERDCMKMVGMPDIERAVCDFFRVTPKELQSAKRSRTVTQPRMLAMFLMRKHTRAAYSEIGDHFGGRNHATVISAEKRVRGWLESGETVRVAAEDWSLGEVVAVIEQRLAS